METSVIAILYKTIVVTSIVKFVSGQIDPLSFRIRKEIRDLQKDPVEGLIIRPDPANLKHLNALLKGPTGSPFETGIFRLDLTLQNEYPKTPPVIKFKTKVYHPNVNESGGICLDILLTEWTPTLGIRTACLSVQSLLAEPYLGHYLAQDIGKLWEKDVNKAKENAKRWTERYAREKEDIEAMEKHQEEIEEKRKADEARKTKKQKDAEARQALQNKIKEMEARKAKKNMNAAETVASTSKVEDVQSSNVLQDEIIMKKANEVRDFKSKAEATTPKMNEVQPTTAAQDEMIMRKENEVRDVQNKAKATTSKINEAQPMTAVQGEMNLKKSNEVRDVKNTAKATTSCMTDGLQKEKETMVRADDASDTKEEMDAIKVEASTTKTKDAPAKKTFIQKITSLVKNDRPGDTKKKMDASKSEAPSREVEDAQKKRNDKASGSKEKFNTSKKGGSTSKMKDVT